MTTDATFKLPRRTGSAADVLEAIGAAHVICHIAGVSEEAVRLVLVNDVFEIRVKGAGGPQQPIAPLFPYFKADENDQVQPMRGEVYDYAADRKRNEERKKTEEASMKNQKPKVNRGRRARVTARAALSEEQEDRGRASSRWPTYNGLQSLTKGGFQGEWNKTWSLLDGMDENQSKTMAAALFRNLHAAPTPLDDLVTLAQHLNAIAAKGANGAKPGAVKRDNIKSSRLGEWFKSIAFDRCTFVRRVGDDIRMWIPIPRDIALSALTAARRKFEETAWRPGDIKQDVLAAIDFATALAMHWLERKQPPRRRANVVVRALESITYKDMGGGYVVMNITAYGIPGWVDLPDEAALEVYLQALAAFRSAASSLNEEHSDDVSALSALRDALGANGAAPLLRFFVEYAAFVQRRVDSGFAYRFDDGVLDAVLGGIQKMLDGIVHNQGFRNLATAIRKATVGEQWHKREGRQVYEIHYGLFMDLRRALSRRTEFVAELATFVARYNAENARIAETHRENGRLRARVSDSDLDAVVHLIDAHGSELVGSLLCAYGSATERETETDATTSSAATA